jgi:hypothetical protein
MRKLSAAIAVFTVALTVSTPAWADTVQQRHHHFSGRSDTPREGNSGYDGQHHDDDDGSVLF